MFSKNTHRVILWLLYLNCFLLTTASAQYFDFTGNKKKTAIPFRLVRNMVIIQLKINNKGPFNFVMDTGVGIMIITDPGLIDSLQIPVHRMLKLRGFGEDEAYDAYASPELAITVSCLRSFAVDAAILKKDHFGLSSYAGMPIHGLLGYEFFNNLAVKVNFSDSTITVYNAKDKHKFAKGEKIPITIEAHKPYMEANVYLPDGNIKKSKLVVDLGAGHPLSLENIDEHSGIQKKCIHANLGVGFSGPINGFLSRISQIEFGKYKIKNVISSFPQDDSLKNYINVKRDGNLGIGLLKKFIVVFDYPDNAIYLKPGPNFKEPFEQDMSGLEYYADGDDFKRIIISRVEPGSAGDQIGLEKNDEILAINLKPIAKMSLEEVDSIFKSWNDRSLLLEIYHDNRHDLVIMKLKRRI
ncbi:aspartyl protease family protein [Mucilaginibacter sp. BJC16-A38]|uniref:PDZ domain-containing protein n=1 Tax=Mucilaginibacter phenanthrenivorans TaxID=1234842 RepID=UPI002158566C|nr:PDZ domain-containing protein [Mucilaginibacter phenanthrenivorans]MCR8556347.1 aspartyl protease family protein [Mucilaginibacter phenanthrenivorans]